MLRIYNISKYKNVIQINGYNINPDSYVELDDKNLDMSKLKELERDGFIKYINIIAEHNDNLTLNGRKRKRKIKGEDE